MPIIVSCPTCSGQLRIAADLIGRRVRCPACSSTFDAAEAAPAPRAPVPEPDFPVETESVPAWKHLDLELSSESKAGPANVESPAGRNGSSGTKGAVEIEVSEEASPRSTPENKTPRRAERRSRRDEEDDDRRPCPECGKLIERDATRCYSCGERVVKRGKSRRDDDD